MIPSVGIVGPFDSDADVFLSQLGGMILPCTTAVIAIMKSGQQRKANKRIHRLKVKNDEFGPDRLAAWSCIRLDRLQQGYRFIRLFNAKGENTDGFLLVKISKKIA
jgi:hypothetical protein